MTKIFVGVVARFGSDGGVTPLSVIWPDGRLYPIEAVLALKVARGAPDHRRYTVRIHGRDAYLYRAQDRWFMDRAE